MADLPALRPIACVAALNAAVQGLVGVVLSILALCVCFCALASQAQSTGNSFTQYLTYYLQGEECRGNDYNLYTDVTSPTAMRVWMALSLFFSAFMFVSSLVLVVAVAKRWSDEKLQITLVSWLFINTFTAVDDVILGYVFGHDYLSTQDAKPSENLGQFTLAVVTFLAVRGVYLWLLNVALILYLFTGARALHKYLNEQMPTLQDQEPIESWPTLDDFRKSEVPDIARTPSALNPRLPERENGQVRLYPEYLARARWPTDGEAQTVRETRAQRREESRERRSKTVRETGFRPQEGFENPAFVQDNKYYLRLQSDTGSSKDFEEYSTDPPDRSGPEDPRRSQDRERNRERDRHRSKDREGERDRGKGKDLPKNQRWEVYRQYTPDPWNEQRPPPPPTTEYLEDTEVPIPPVDYLDPQPTGSTSSGDRTMSLQEAILDRTLRLKKVPEALKKGF